MKALAYVSDEMYLALPDVAAEFHSEESGEVTLLRSSPQGAFYADLKPGRYRVTLSKSGYGSKTSEAVLGGDRAVPLPIVARPAARLYVAEVGPRWGTG